MPLYEFKCTISENREEHWSSIADRDAPRFCKCHDIIMGRLPGGHGMLYFEEGRARLRSALSDKPITSHAEHQRLMKKHGVIDAGDTLPPGISKKEPKTEAMKRYRSKDRGKWI